MSGSEAEQSYSQKENRHKKHLTRSTGPVSYEKRPKKKLHDVGIKEMLDLQAEEESQEEEITDSSAQQQAQEIRQHYEQLYKVKHKRPTELLIEKLEEKTPTQINRLYSNKAKQAGESQRLKFRSGDHMLFSIGCRKGSEQQLVLNILNKAMHCISQPTKFPYKCTISSAFSIPSNYPGVIFVEAPGEAQVRESLETFTDINLKRIKPESKIIYNVLFRNKSNRRSDFTEKQMVRIKSGVYKGDLGKIVKILNNRVKLLVVPRVDLKKMNNLMLQAEEKFQDRALVEKKNIIFKSLTDPKIFYNPSSRPPRRMISLQSFRDYEDLSAVKKLTVTEKGMLILYFKLQYIQKLTGSVLPIELQPFSITDNTVKEFEEGTHVQLILAPHLAVGQEVEIVSGQLNEVYGKIVECANGKSEIRVQNKEIKGMIIPQLPEHIEKRFLQGMRVCVTEGRYKGSQGTVIKVSKDTIRILTSNNNEVEALRRNATRISGHANIEENQSTLTEREVIKTTKGVVGLILNSSCNYYKILTLQNNIETIGILECGGKINTKGSVATNRYGDCFRSNSMIRIMDGQRKNLVCQVRNVYQSHLFLESRQIVRNDGFCVQDADRCKLIVQNPYFQKKQQKQNANQRKDIPIQSRSPFTRMNDI